MAFPVLGGQAFEVRFFGRADGQTLLNVHKLRLLTVAGAENSATLAESVFGKLFPAATRKAHTASNYVVERVELLRITDVVGIPPPAPPGLMWQYGLMETYIPALITAQGSGPSPWLPTFVAVAAKYSGQVPIVGGTFKTVRGGNRFGQLLEVDTDNSQGGNILTTMAFTDWNTFVQATFPALQTTVNGSTFRFCVGTLNGNITVAGPLDRIQPIETAATNPLVSSQVSRKRRP